MKRVSLGFVTVLIASQTIVMAAAAASGNSRYDALLKSPAGQEKLAAIARMEDSARIDPQLIESLVSDAAPLIRVRCAEALGRIGDPGGVPYLVKLVDDENLHVAETAVYSLGLVGDPSVLEPLRRCLAEKPAGIKERSLEALGKTGKKDAAPLITPSMRNFSAAIRAQAALALAFTTDSASASACDATIYDPDPHVVACALYTMGRLGYREGADHMAELLAHESPEVRFRAVEALGRLKAEQAVPLIATLTKDSDRMVAIKAAEALGRIGNKKGAPALVDLLISQDAYLKTVALNGLAVIGEKKQFESIKPLLNDPSPMVRRAALGGAAATGGGDARKLLLTALERGTASEKMTALEQLGTLSASEDLLLIVRTLVSSSELLEREGAAAGLGNWKRPAELGVPCGFEDSRGRKLTPIEALFEAANGSDWVIASIAIESLGKIAPVDIVPDLMHVFDAHEARLDGDRKLAVIEAIRSKASKIDADDIEKFGLRAFLAKASADPDTRVASAAAIAAGAFGTDIKAAPAGVWERGRYPWGAPALPLGERKIVLSTSRGDIEIRLYGDDAPNAVKSILSLADSGFYDGLTLHRIVPGFVVQGGCPRGDGWGDGGYLLRNEINMYRYERGAVGMADSGKDTAGSQFFITHTPQPHLNGRYTIVGKVTRGMAVVDAIEEGDIFSIAIIE
jgi:cyclophilin family peptidyl-prolyl cis-trans isomerase/HEAT repeat protein